MKASQRLYLTSDRETVVVEGDVRAAFLLAPVGRDIPKEFVEQAKALGEPDDDDEAVDEAEPEEKAAAKPANKAAKRAANK